MRSHKQERFLRIRVWTCSRKTRSFNWKLIIIEMRLNVTRRTRSYNFRTRLCRLVWTRSKSFKIDSWISIEADSLKHDVNEDISIFWYKSMFSKFVSQEKAVPDYLQQWSRRTVAIFFVKRVYVFRKNGDYKFCVNAYWISPLVPITKLIIVTHYSSEPIGVKMLSGIDSNV